MRRNRFKGRRTSPSPSFGASRGVPVPTPKKHILILPNAVTCLSSAAGEKLQIWDATPRLAEPDEQGKADATMQIVKTSSSVNLFGETNSRKLKCNSYFRPLFPNFRESWPLVCFAQPQRRLDGRSLAVSINCTKYTHKLYFLGVSLHTFFKVSVREGCWCEWGPTEHYFRTNCLVRRQ